MSNQKHTPDSLADRLDEVLPPDQLIQTMTDHDPLVEAAAQVAQAPRPALSPDVLARIQAQVLDAQLQQQPATQTTPAIRVMPPVLRWLLVAGLAFVVLFAVSLPAALASVPGDALYPVKQAIENVELGLSAGPQSEALMYLNFAERRTVEFEVLLQRGTVAPHLVDAALDNMILAADRAQSGAVDTTLLQRRTIGITAQLNRVLQTAVIQNPDENLDTLLSAAQATQASGDLLLPPQPTATPLPPATGTPPPPPVLTFTATPVPVVTATAVPSSTSAMPTVTVTPTASPSATLTATEPPVNLVIEGPIEALTGSMIVIYGIEIEIDVDNPLLAVLQVGDIIRVSGSISTSIDQAQVDAVAIEILNVDTMVNPDDSSQVWRDSGDCTNPPPPWAPASGWRARCGGGGQSNPGNSGNSGGGSNQGGRGGDDDDD